MPLVCIFSTDQERFRTFSAAGLHFSSRPGAFSAFQCRWSAIFRQTRSVFGLLVLPVCIFQADQERFWAFSAGGLRFLSRPPTFLGLQCCRPAIFKQATNVFGPSVPEVCNFSAGYQRFWAFSAGGLHFFSRPRAVLAVQCRRSAIFSRLPAVLSRPGGGDTRGSSNSGILTLRGVLIGY